LQAWNNTANSVFDFIFGQIPAFEEDRVLSDGGNSNLDGKTEPLQNDPVVDFVQTVLLPKLKSVKAQLHWKERLGRYWGASKI
jgi:hypothetical protein